MKTKEPSFDHIRIHGRNRKKIEALLKNHKYGWELSLFIPLIVLAFGLIALLLIF